MNNRYYIRCDDCGEEWTAAASDASAAIVEHNDQCDSQFETTDRTSDDH